MGKGGRRAIIESLESRRHFDAGQIDPNFGGEDGVELIHSKLFNLQAEVLTDGRVALHGLYRAQLSSEYVSYIRVYRPDGSEDLSFDGDAVIRRDVMGVQLNQLLAAPGGRMLVVGSNAAGGVSIVRLRANGSIDRTFGTLGIATVATAQTGHSAFINSDGSILLFAQNDLLFRFSADGQLDTTFGANGRLDVAPGLPARSDPESSSIFRIARISEVVRLADGKLLLAYDEEEATTTKGVIATSHRREVRQFLLRLSANGTPDTSFGAGGRIEFNAYTEDDDDNEDATPPERVGDPVTSIDLFSDGTMMAVQGGNVVRLKADGTPDNTFGGDGTATLSFRGQPPGRLTYLRRLADGGALVESVVWSASVGGPDSVEMIHVGADGTINEGFGIGGSFFLPGDSSEDPFATNGPVLAPDGSIYTLRQFTLPRSERYQLVRLWREDGPAGPYAPRGIVVAPAPTSTHKLRVTWRDDGLVDLESLQSSFLRVVAPDGSTSRARLHALDRTADASVIQATYVLSAPGGTWDAADNGVWAVRLPGETVFDTEGNAATARRLGEFVVAI